jgi:hypothetical protein
MTAQIHETLRARSVLVHPSEQFLALIPHPDGVVDLRERRADMAHACFGSALQRK